MAKIKVNELETATPQLTDTLLASGADKEYALPISDLKDTIAPSGGGALIVEITTTNDGDTITEAMNKTWKEIHDAVLSGKVVYFRYINDQDTIYTFSYISMDADLYYVSVDSYGVFTTQEENGYPQVSPDGGGGAT